MRVLGWTCFCVAVAALGLLSASLRGLAPTTPVWLSSAVILVVALRGASTLAGRAGVVALGSATMAALGLALGRPLFWVLATNACAVLEIALGLVFLRGLKSPVLGASGFLRLVVGASMVGPLASTLAVTVLYVLMRGGMGAGAFALCWFAAHALGMMVAAPVLLSVGSGTVSGMRTPRIAAVHATVFAVTLFAFLQAFPACLVLIAPLMGLAVFAGGEAGAAVALGLTGLTAATLTALGFGPEAGSPSLYLYQAFLACLAVGAHALVAVARQLEGYSTELGETAAGLPRRPAE